MSDFKHLSVNQLVHMLDLDTELAIVDIRDATSFEASHIPNAFNLNNENLAHYLADADMDKPLVVVCYHGISSQSAAQYLHEQGFDDIYSLDGGHQAWQQAQQ